MPYVENGTFYLIGATTANPYIALNRAIRSRCRLLEVKPLTDEEVVKGLRRAIEIEKGLNNRNLDNDNLELLKTILHIIKYFVCPSFITCISYIY